MTQCTDNEATLAGTSSTWAEPVRPNLSDNEFKKLISGVATGTSRPSTCTVAQNAPEPLLTRVRPFDGRSVGLPDALENAVQFELTKTDGIMYDNMLEYLSKNIPAPSSLRLGWKQDNARDEEADGERPAFQQAHNSFGSGHGKTPNSEIGLGLHELAYKFEDDQKRTIYVLSQTLGNPIGTFREASFYQSLIIFLLEDDRKTAKLLLEEFLRAVWRVSTKTDKAQVSIWRFDLKNAFWSKVVARKPRDFSLVVLDKETKTNILDDLTWFLKEDTADFYSRHGIPYHRAYLFYGPPGSGKTSTIFALAGAFQRNLCFIQTDTGMTDDSFRTAVGQAPPKSIIVMEDVDSLFTIHRETSSKHSSLTFSGFLNAIDGLASPEDVVFVLTTNHPERLDPALLRPGRVDVRVEFKTPNSEMAREYFKTYYQEEGSDESAKLFAKNITKGHIPISMAQMQHYFLHCHRRQFDHSKAASEVTNFAWQKPIGREENNNMMY